MNQPTLTMTTRLLAFTAFLILLAAPESHASPAFPVTRTPESAVTPSEQSRHAAFLRQIKDGNGDFDFVLIGDSITDFWQRSAPAPAGKDSYARFAPWKPLDLGVSGETTEEVLWRLLNGELDGIHPKVVMIMIGTNNLGIYPNEKPEWVAAGIQKIIETVRAKQPKAKILLLAIFPRGATSTDLKRQRVDEVNKLLPALADDKNVFFMDIGSKFLDPQGTLPREIMPDLLHPNAQGYRIWIEAVRPKLEELMGSPLAPAVVAAPSPAPVSSAPPSTNTLSK